MRDLATLCLDEEATIRGHRVRRQGLCGEGAYLVDGEPLSLAAAGRAIAAPARKEPSKPAASKVIPELLEEVRAAVGRGPFRYQHRTFAGGEAVEIGYTSTENQRAALEGAMRLLVMARFHVEWSADRLVVVSNAAVLAPRPAEKKRPAA